MSLSAYGYRERKWGPFPALRKILEDKPVPDRSFGSHSAGDTFFEAVDRLVEITLLTREFRDELVEAATNDFDGAFREDLKHLESELESAKEFFDRQINKQIDAIRGVCDSLKPARE